MFKSNLGTHGRQPLFSAVVALYNVEKYLQSFLSSLDRQTVDSQVVEYIFVDDASTDQTREIVGDWAKGRSNVRLLSHSSNRGVSAARNSGYDAASGAWVTSIDPDDILDRNYFKEVAKWIHLNGEDSADLITTRVVNYNETLGIAQFSHPLDYKFRSGDRLFNINTEPRIFQLGATAFMKTDVLRKERIRFDESIRPTFEDAHLISRYLLSIEDPKVLVLSSALYFYRQRSSDDSLVSSAWQSPQKYSVEIERGYLDLIQKAVAVWGFVPRWLENILIYQLSWQFIEAEKPRGKNAWIRNSEKTLDTFLELCRKVFSHVSWEAVADFSVKEIPYWIKGSLLAYFYGPTAFEVDTVDQQHGANRLFVPQLPVRVEGTVRARYLFGKLFAYELEQNESKQSVEVKFGRSIDSTNGLVTPPPQSSSLAMRLSGSDDGLLGLLRAVDINVRLMMIPQSAELPRPLVPLAMKVGKKMPTLLRRIYLKAALYRAERSSAGERYRDAWIITDRMSGANDNGEHFYRYLQAHDAPENIFFMISKNSPDYARLKAEGFRILPESVSHVASALANAQVIIASDWAADDLAYVWNLRSGKQELPLVFLQHGVTKDDISHWVNSLRADMFVASLPEEYEYLTAIDSPYFFKHDEVALVGLARFDRLRSLSRTPHPASRKPPIRITVMPTWRNSLRDRLRDLPDTERLNAFRQTVYYKSWTAFLNTPKIVEMLEARVLEIDFVSHPNIVEYLNEYELSPFIRTHDIRECDFQQILVDTDIYLTDYSSAVYDAILGGAQVAYYQFDREAFFGGEQSMIPGWFDYDRDGYGPVFKSATDLTAWIERKVATQRRTIRDNEVQFSQSSCVFAERRELVRKSIPRNSCEKTYREIRRRFS